MEIIAAGSFEALVPIYQNARRHITKDNNCYSHHRQNLKSQWDFSLSIESTPVMWHTRTHSAGIKGSFLRGKGVGE
jgi:hypothetical protein